jgi:hypothetical protein
MALRHLETTINRLLQNRFLRRSEGRVLILRPIRLHKNHLSDVVQVVFSVMWKQKRSSLGLSTPWNIDWSTSANTFFYDGQRANYEFSGPFAYFKYHLSNYDQFAFSDVQDKEKKFAWPFDTLKHGFIDFIKVVFEDVRKAVYEFSGPFTYLKHHISDLFQVAFFYAQREKNYFAWPLVTLKHRFIDFIKSFFRRLESRICFLRVIRLHKKLLKQLRPSRFLYVQDSKNDFEWIFETL